MSDATVEAARKELRTLLLKVWHKHEHKFDGVMWAAIALDLEDAMVAHTADLTARLASATQEVDRWKRWSDEKGATLQAAIGAAMERAEKAEAAVEQARMVMQAHLDRHLQYHGLSGVCGCKEWADLRASLTSAAGGRRE